MNQSKKWLARIFRFLFTLLGAGIGILIAVGLKNLNFILEISLPHFIEIMTVGLILLFALIFYLLYPKAVWLLEQFMAFIEKQLADMPLSDLLLGFTGIILGLVVAFLVSRPIDQIPYVGGILSIFIHVIFAYVGYQLLGHRKAELSKRITELSLPKIDGFMTKKDKLEDAKVLDTSVLIDGRILDISQTGFIEDPLVVPVFVLEELQHIADSQDASKRARGRRGLDILKQMQDHPLPKIVISDQDFKEIPEVDSKLLKLAKVLNAKIMTNDYNLNKVANVQGLDVLNINDLANALRPVVLSGEDLLVTILKGGTEAHQGVAYLDDGTMVVVENGRDLIGQRLSVTVTSILQTSAGKMIFAKRKDG